MKSKESILGYLLITTIFSIVMAVIWEVPLTAILPMLILASFFAALADAMVDSPKTRNVMMGVYVLLLIVMTFDVEYSFLPMRGSDNGYYTWMAQSYIKSGLSLSQLIVIRDTDIFSLIVSILYRTFGLHKEVVHCFVFFTAQVCKLYFVKLCYLVFADRRERNVAIKILTIIPVFCLHSIVYLRELPLACLFTISLYYYIKYMKKSNAIYMMIALLVSSLAAAIHMALVAVPFGYIVFRLFYSPNAGRISYRASNFIVVLLFMMVFFFSPLRNYLMKRFTSLENIYMDDSAIAGTTTYISGAPGSLSGMLLQTPYRFLLFEVVPLPWMIRNIGTMISWILDGVMRFIFIENYIKLIRRKKEIYYTNIEKGIILLGFIIWLSFGIICAWGVTAYGTAMRHRVKILPIEVILLTFALRSKR